MAVNKNQKDKDTPTVYQYKTNYQRGAEQFSSEVEDNARKIEESDIPSKEKDTKPSKKDVPSSRMSLRYV